MNIVKFNFNGYQVGFNNNGWINATEAAKRFSKRPIDWIVLPTTTSYLSALSDALKEEVDVRKSHFGLIVTKRGGRKSVQGQMKFILAA